MKKGVVALVLILLLLVVGCLNKSTDQKNAADVAEEQVLEDIAKLENEVAAENAAVKASVADKAEVVAETPIVKEVVLPELTEKKIPEEVNLASEQVITVKENDLISLSVKVDDPDQDMVKITFGKPLNDKGQWKTNYGDAGEYLTAVSATDGVLTTTKNVRIVVERVNVAPVLDVVKDIVVKEGAVVTFEAKAKDPNNDAITVTVSDPLKSGSFVTDHTSAGEYEIKVVASDGELSTEKMFKLIVQDVNVKPEIKNVQDLTVKEGDKVLIEPIVTDLDEGDHLLVGISSPVGDDGVWQTSFTDHGNYTITVTATDGKDTITQKVKLVIQDVNMPPEITKISLSQ